MTETPFPPIRTLLPHGKAAVLLERVVAHDAMKTVCTVDPEAGTHFRDDDGSIPAYVGLEYMAQTIAAHGGLAALEEQAEAAAASQPRERTDEQMAGEPPHARPGFFVGTRRMFFHVDRFAQGEPLVVSAVHVRSTGALHAFDCAIAGASGAPMVSGVLTVYLLESFEALAEDFSAND